MFFSFEDDILKYGKKKYIVDADFNLLFLFPVYVFFVSLYDRIVIASAIRHPKVLCRYTREGPKMRETNDADEAPNLANHFETVFTSKSYLP